MCVPESHTRLPGRPRPPAPSSPQHSCLQLFSAAPGEKRRLVPSLDTSSLLWLSGRGAPQGSGMRSRRPSPAAPLSLFTPPHSWQCPAQRWPGAQRGQAVGKGSSFPLVAPPRGYPRRELRARSREREPEGRWAERGHPESRGWDGRGLGVSAGANQHEERKVGGAKGNRLDALIGGV